MKGTLFLHIDAADRLCWHDAGQADARCGSAADVAADATAKASELTLVVPAQKVLLQNVEFEAQERRLLRQTVPYSVEERLVADVDEQHFALGRIDGQQVPVAIVDRQWLAQWLAGCAEAGLDIKRVVPEQLLLPYRPGCWTLWTDRERWLVRVGAFAGFALEAGSAALALQLLLDSAETLPEKLLVGGDTAPEMLALQLPELLRGSIEELDAAALDAPAADLPSIDLLQGAFARTLPWRRWWTQWQRPALVLAAAFGVHLLVLGVQHHQLNRQNIALRQQIEAVYRSVEPRGVVADPELQLRRKLAVLQHRDGGGVMPLLQQVGAALKSVDDVSLQNLTFSERQNELRMNISATAFKDIEAARAAIASTGLNAQLIGSNTDGAVTRAQLRVNAQR